MSFLNVPIWKLIVSPFDKHFTHTKHLFIGKNEILVRLHETPIGNLKSSYRTKYYLAECVNNRDCETANRKLILLFPGRNYNFIQIDKLMYIQRLYETNKLFEFDIVIMIYPKKAKSIEQLSQSCQLLLKHLLESGYEQRNISIIGWCLGAYFATETLKMFAQSHPKCQENAHTGFNMFISMKSFSSITEFLYYILPRYLRCILRLYPIKRYVKTWDSSSIKSLFLCEELIEKIFVIYSDKDRIVREFAHLYKHLNENEKLYIKEDQDRIDHKPNWKMIASLINLSPQN
jgi:hypothetical protein